MSEPHRCEIVLGDACWVAAEREATRLGIDVAQLAERATCAWLIDSAENAALVGICEAPTQSAG